MYSKLKANIIMILYFCYFFVHQIALSLVYYFWPTDITTLNLINQITLFSVPVLIYIIVKKRPIRELFAINPIDIKNIFFVASITFLLQPISIVINGVINIYYPNDAAEYVSSMTGSPFWYMLLSIAVAPAIFEELMFRGVIFSEFRNENKTVWLFFTGLYFGIMHLTIHQLFYATLYGIVFAYFIIKTKSIFSSMIGHFVLNGSQVCLLYLSLSEEIVEETTAVSELSNLSESVATIILGSILTGIVSPILYILIKRFNKYNIKNEGRVLFKEPVKEDITDFSLPNGLEEITGMEEDKTEDEDIEFSIPQYDVAVEENKKDFQNNWFIVSFIVICLIFILIMSLSQ